MRETWIFSNSEVEVNAVLEGANNLRNTTAKVGALPFFSFVNWHRAHHSPDTVLGVRDCDNVDCFYRKSCAEK